MFHTSTPYESHKEYHQSCVNEITRFSQFPVHLASHPHAVDGRVAYGDMVQAIFAGVTHNFTVTYGSLVDLAPRKSSSVRSSLKEAATYIVFRMFDPIKAYKIQN
mmetsp:Transcript_7145/g.22073  ORF Transcript_7145/g.22073 Transcript_7145/m.22073 type:complete len:105 (+) Transcript_7145:1016-1330(+)